MNEEDCTFAHFIYPRLLETAIKKGVDPAIFHLIFEQKDHPDMQKLLDDMCLSVVMTISQHKDVRLTFEKLRKALIVE